MSRVRNIARGNVRSGSRTSSAMLASPSNPMNANTASRTVPTNPATIVESTGGTISGRRVRIGASDANPAMIKSSKPPISMRTMMPANVIDSFDAAPGNCAHCKNYRDDEHRQWQRHKHRQVAALPMLMAAEDTTAMPTTSKPTATASLSEPKAARA